jgi:3-deoxy-D-arabino-heptulosonate 7-phosphate (DAHP) synthase class II
MNLTVDLHHRFGAGGAITCQLPKRTRSRKQIYGVNDACGNTAGGIKTRRFEKVLDELQQTFRSLRTAAPALGASTSSSPETTSPNLGGASGITEADLRRDYRTQLDPRLNYEQSMEWLCYCRG